MFPVIDKKKTGINLRLMMDKRGLTVKDVQQYLGLGSVQSVYHWLNGLSMPTIDNLYALSALFQLPIDSIVQGNREPIESTYSFDSTDLRNNRLFEYYHKINAYNIFIYLIYIII